MRYLGKPVCWQCFCALTKDIDDSSRLQEALGIPSSEDVASSTWGGQPGANASRGIEPGTGGPRDLP